jgi:hypothetical protein
MRCEPAFIAEQPRGSFAAFVRNTTKNAISLKFPLMPRFKPMSKEQYAAVLSANRAKYATHYQQALNPPSKPDGSPPPAPALPIADDSVRRSSQSDQPSEPPKQGEQSKASDDAPLEKPKRSKWPL